MTGRRGGKATAATLTAVMVGLATGTGWSVGHVPSPVNCSHAGHDVRFRTGANDGCTTCGVTW